MELTATQEAQIAGGPIVCPRPWAPPNTRPHTEAEQLEAARAVAAGEPGVAYRGRVWRLSPRFVAESVEPHADLARAPLETLWRELILTGRKSNAFGLTPAERARWEAVNRHICVRRALSFIGDRPLPDFDMEFADQIHGNSRGLACGCVLHVVFDHYKIRSEEGRNRSPFHPHTPRQVCERHAKFADDLERLHTFAELDQAAYIAAETQAA